MNLKQKKSLFTLIIFVFSFLTSNVFLVERAKADLNGYAASNPKFSYPDSTKNTINWNFNAPANETAASNGDLTPYMFPFTKSTMTMAGDQIKPNNSFPASDVFTLYKSAATTIDFPSTGWFLTLGSISGFWAGPVYLIVKGDKVYGSVGTFFPKANQIGAIFNLSDPYVWSILDPQGTDGYGKQYSIAALALVNNGSTHDITSNYGDPTTVAGLCKNTLRDWEDMKLQMRNLFMPMPGSTGTSQNPNWVINSAMGQTVDQAVTPANIAKSVAGDIGLPVGDVEFDVQILSLSTQGTATFQQVQKDATAIKSAVASIKQKTNTDNVATACGADNGLVTFKWVANNARPYDTFTNFLKDVDKYNKFAVDAVGILQTPESVSNNECGPTSFAKFFTDMRGAITAGFCNFVMLIHSLAVGFLSWSVQQFTQVVGIKEY